MMVSAVQVRFWEILSSSVVRRRERRVRLAVERGGGREMIEREERENQVGLFTTCTLSWFSQMY